MKVQEYVYRDAVAGDRSAILNLILTEGKTPVNIIPGDWVRAHVGKIGTGDVEAVVVEHQGAIVGVVTYEMNKEWVCYQPPSERMQDHGYAAEACVHSDHRGKGLGTKLFAMATERLFQKSGVIYTMRHEKNHASAAMMRKCGYEHVDTFEDPRRELVEGSTRTTVMRKYAPVHTSSSTTA